MDKTKFKKRWNKDKEYAPSGFITTRDNKGAYNRSKIEKLGNLNYVGRIRVPSLKRSKATWKRFYKLFPELKGQDRYLDGNSTSELNNINESYIPLKKI